MLISAINALTLSPALCARLAAPITGRKRGPIGYVLRGIDKARDGYARGRRAAGALRRPVGLVLLLAVLPAPAWLFKHHADRLPAAGGPGRLLRRGRSCRRAPRSTAPRRWPSRSRRSSRDDRRRRRRQRRSSASACIDGLRQVEHRLPDRRAEAVRGAHDRGDCRSTASSAGCARQVRAIRTANVVAFNLPPIIGLGTGGGFEYQLQDLQRREPGRSGAAPCAGWSSPPTRTRRLRGVFSTFCRQHAAALSRHRPRQGADAGRRRLRRLHRAAGDARRLLRQRLQPVRPHLAGEHPGRGGRPRSHRRHLPHPCPQHRRRDGAAARLRRARA